MKVKEVKEYLDGLYPFSNKCEWDNCGLLIGDGENEVTSIGFALDLTRVSLKDAEEQNINLIITHHPVIFSPQKSFLSGNIAYEAAVRGISVISCHTCYDSADGGVSDILAEKIGLKNIKVLETEEKPFCVRTGEISPVSPEAFAFSVSSALSAFVRFTRGNRDIKKVAVCGGGGGDFMEEVILSGADAYVTGDISHHQFLTAAENGLTLIAAGHYETENISMLPLRNKVSEKFPKVKCVMLFSENPVSFIMPEE